MTQLAPGTPIEHPVPPGIGPRVLQHPVGTPVGNYHWVYLWQLPIRVMHWIAAAAMVVLILTGFYIGRPYFLTQSLATGSFSFQWARLLHFVAAALLVGTAIVRVYWLFAGNKFERLPALFPIRPRDLANLLRQIKHYSFLDRHEIHYIGHNPLQQIFYTSMYMAAVVMVLTGFALYGTADPQGFIWRNFAWVNDVLGGLPHTRLLHHVLTWYFLMFIPGHVYFVLRSDIYEVGNLSSIINGGKFVQDGIDYVDHDPADPDTRR
jgi:Ni/Fe-hydrogenase 1 B-type cytochrome subunit